MSAAASPEAALWRAAHHGDLASVLRLLRGGADPRQAIGPKPAQSTALHEGALAQSVEIVGALLSVKARANALDAQRNTALHAACAGGASLAVLRALIAAGANVDARNADGVPPLHLAVKAGGEPAIRLLVAAGADPLLSDFQGQDALSHSRDEATDRLLQHLITSTTDEAEGRRIDLGAGGGGAESQTADKTIRATVLKALLPEGLDEFDATDEDYEKALALSDRMTAAFAKLDVDKSGAISRKELRVALESAGARISSREAVELFAKGDLDGDGMLSAEEFALLGPQLKKLLVALVPKKKAKANAPSGGAGAQPRGAAAARAPSSSPYAHARSPARGEEAAASPARRRAPRPSRPEPDEQASLRLAFEAQDSDASGLLSMAEALKALNAHGVDTTTDAVLEAARAFKASDANKDGALDFDEFVQLSALVRDLGVQGAAGGAAAAAAAAADTRAALEAQLRDAFEKQDVDQSGLLRIGEALAALGGLGVDTASEAALRAARGFKATALRADGLLDLAEFVALHAALSAKPAAATPTPRARAKPAGAATPKPASRPAAAAAAAAERRSPARAAAAGPRSPARALGAGGPVLAAGAHADAAPALERQHATLVLSIDRLVVEPWLLADAGGGKAAQAPRAPTAATAHSHGGQRAREQEHTHTVAATAYSPAAADAAVPHGGAAPAGGSLTVLTRAFEPNGAAESTHHTPPIPLAQPAEGGGHGGQGGHGDYAGGGRFGAGALARTPTGGGGGGYDDPYADPYGGGFGGSYGGSYGGGYGGGGGGAPTPSGAQSGVGALIAGGGAGSQLVAHLRCRHRLIALSVRALVDFTLVLHAAQDTADAAADGLARGATAGGGGAWEPPQFLADGRIPLEALLGAARQALGGADGLGVGVSGSASAIEVVLLDARERVAATLHVTAQLALDAASDEGNTGLSRLLPQTPLVPAAAGGGGEAAGAARLHGGGGRAEVELSQLRASHTSLLRNHVALQAEVRRSRHAHGAAAGAVPDAMLKPHGAGGGHGGGGASDWRAQALPALRKTVLVLEGARVNWRGDSTALDDAHETTAAAYRQLAQLHAHGVQALPGASALPRHAVRDSIGGASRPAATPVKAAV